MLRPLLLAVALLPIAFSRADCEQFRCPRCGCCRHKSVCRSVCEMQEKVTYEYQLDCDMVCLPAPSEKCGKKCVSDDRSLCGFHWETIWKPRCGCIRQQRTLTKIPVKKQEPVYACVYHCICCNCGYEEGDELTPQEQPPSPEPPEADEKIAQVRRLRPPTIMPSAP